MANYYQVQRSSASTTNGRYFNHNGKYVAVFPFYLRKQGGINAWEFTATRTVNNTEKGVTPTGFKAYLFSCAQAFIDFLKSEYNSVFDSPVLKHTFRGVEETYLPPNTYTGNPADYVIIGGPSQRDTQTYPVPNCVAVGHTEGDRPYQSEDGENFWRLEDGCHYFSLIVFDSNPNLTTLRSTIYYN